MLLERLSDHFWAVMHKDMIQERGRAHASVDEERGRGNGRHESWVKESFDADSERTSTSQDPVYVTRALFTAGQVSTTSSCMTGCQNRTEHSTPK